MFRSYTTGFQLPKMKMYSINLIGAYVGDHRKINSKHRLLSKTVNFFQLEINLMKKVVYFLIPCRCRSLSSNFHAWILRNNKVIDSGPLPLEHYLKFVLKVTRSTNTTSKYLSRLNEISSLLTLCWFHGSSFKGFSIAFPG